MPIRKPKPTSPGMRFVSYPDFAEITKSKPEKTLVEGLKKSGGRNAPGARPRATAAAAPSAPTAGSTSSAARTACRRKVAAIEYDPNRSAYIALLHYVDGEKRYILAPARLTVGMTRRLRATAPTSRSATACRSRACRSARSCTTSSCSPAAAARWRARPEPRRS